MRQLLILSLLTVVGIASGASTSFGQDTWSPTKKIRKYRYLGLFVGDGYHVCNPGPDSSWYNPYSRHNQELFIRGGAASDVRAIPANSNSEGNIPKIIEGRFEQLPRINDADSANLPAGQSVPWPSESARTPLPPSVFRSPRIAVRPDGVDAAPVPNADSVTPRPASTPVQAGPQEIRSFQDLPPLKR